MERNRLLQELLGLEEDGWRALSGGDARGFYEGMLTANAAMLLPFGVLERVEAIEAMASAPPWQGHQIEGAQVVSLNENGAALIYRVVAVRTGAAEYRALINSTYVRRDGRWRLALHQQTPLDGLS